MSDLEFEIFKGKNFGGLLEDIYNKSKNRERQISILIDELRPLVKNMTDATIIVPLIKEYLDIGVRNDDQLVKMAAIIQRVITASKLRALGTGGIYDSPLGLTQVEIDEIRAEIDNNQKKLENKETKAIGKGVDIINSKKNKNG